MNSTTWRQVKILTPSLFVIALAASGCSSESGGVAVQGSQDTPEMAKVATNVSVPKETSRAQVRQVIRKADLAVRVDNVEKSEKEVGRIIEGIGGYVETASSTDLATQHPVLTMALRVPATTFEQTIACFEALGTRLSKSVSSEDVTNKLVDMDARLLTLRTQEETYRNMLRNHNQLEDVYSIQNKLGEVRTQIEAIAGERKVQAGLAAMSTISLTLEQKTGVMAASTDDKWMSEALGQATSTAGSVLRALVVLLTWTVVFSPFWIPGVLIVRRLTRTSVPKPPKLA